MTREGCNFAFYGICKDGDCKRCPFEPKVGKWIDTGENLHKCSNCGQIIFSQTPYDLEEFHAYCGRCGAKMERRADEHTDKRD